MANDLNTILDDAGNRALVEKYLSEKFMERQDFGTVLANSDKAQEFKLPEKKGQYVEMMRKGRFRMPQNVNLATPSADPLSGAKMALEKLRVPLEAVHEYIALDSIAMWTSIVDLVEWAEEDLMVALRRRFHQLTQNAFVAGRMTPGVWGADGVASTAFDASAAATLSAHGLSFTFDPAPRFYPGGKSAFNLIGPVDRASWSDLEAMRTRMANSGAPKTEGCYDVTLSDAMANDLGKDDKYFQAMVAAFKGEGLKKGEIAQYKGMRFSIDDEPFALGYGDSVARVEGGPIHAAFMYARKAFAYLNHGGKNRMKPTFKVQDISKTGTEKTIGYMVPFQAAIATPPWTFTYVAPVSEYQKND